MAKREPSCIRPRLSCTINDMRVLTMYWNSRRSSADALGCDPDEEDDLTCFRLPFVP